MVSVNSLRAAEGHVEPEGQPMHHPSGPESVREGNGDPEREIMINRDLA